MSLFVKLCGLRTEADLEAAVDAGADAVGFVLTSSPRQIPLARARALMRLLPDRVLGVAVFHDPSPELVRRTETDVAPDLFQADPTALAGVPADRVLPVVVDGEGMGAALERALASTTRDLVLVDSAAKGGTGTPPNWARLGDLAVNHRLLLAGGLDHLNVQRAIEQVRPFGVDVSSGIERRPGEKDPALMRRFVTAARTAWADGMRRQGEML